MIITQELLDSIRVLWRAPDTMTLWGIPYDMRPGQQPYDLWRARRDYVSPPAGGYGSKQVSLEDWIWLGSPGWWGKLTPEERELEERFLDKHKDSIPTSPCEWAKLPKLPNWTAGETAYVAHPEKVEQVTFCAYGDGGRNFLRKKRVPCVVKGAEEEWVVEEHDLFRDPLAAAVKSAELQRELNEDR